ncbi:transcription-associated protein 1 [Metarhizium acridum]|nr:transcription-associated protein 1 [Metarhizium acridum]
MPRSRLVPALFHSPKQSTCFGRITGFFARQKLQQWEILQDFAKHENFQDLLLECAWRNTEMWQDAQHREALDNVIKGVMDAPTPRRAFFQAFMSLLKFHNQQEGGNDFARVCDEAIQLSIRSGINFQSD